MTNPFYVIFKFHKIVKYLISIEVLNNTNNKYSKYSLPDVIQLSRASKIHIESGRTQDGATIL